MIPLQAIRFHDLRHTFASWLIGNGDSLDYVKDQMGHHSIRITVDTCEHLIPGAKRQAVNRLAAIGEEGRGPQGPGVRYPVAACRSKIRTSLKSGETPYIPYP